MSASATGVRPRDLGVSNVLVVGAAEELTPEVLSGVTLTRVNVAEWRTEAGLFAAVIVDVRGQPLDTFVGLRQSSWLADTPLLVLVDPWSASAAEDVLRADDVVDSVITDRALARRLRLLVELGRARLGLSTTEALGHGELARARAHITSLNDALVARQTFDQAVLDGVAVGIITTDHASRVTFVNRAAEELLGPGPDRMGADVAILLGLGSSPAVLLEDGSARTVVEHTLQTTSGEVELELTVSRATELGDDRVGFYFIFRDVGEEKARETERRRFERLAAMGTMVAGFAHEVRNPVAALRSLAESLAEELTEIGVTLPHVTRMLQVLNRIERLVRTSLQFGRPAAPRRAAHRPWTIVDMAVSEMTARTRAIGGELNIEVEQDLPDVFVDDTQLVQVLVVLLNNALDATGNPSRVLIRVSMSKANETETRQRQSQPPPAPTVRYEVIDDGPGIPPDLLGRVFDPFFTTKPAGTGLGLSIAQQIVNENGGRIELSSARDHTSFAIVVPILTLP